MKQDKWGFPRRWPWWRDGMFWAITGLWLPLSFVFGFMMVKQWNTNPNAPLYLIFIGLFLFLNLPGYWFAWDSYRLEIPNRWFFLIFGKWYDPGHTESTSPYFSVRQKVVEELKIRRNKPF